MKRRKIPKRKVGTSKLYKKGCEPISVTKVIRKRKEYDFILNELFKTDIERFNRLFKSKIPKYFLKLRNELKNKNRVDEILRYAKLYTDKVYTIVEIDNMQFVSKKIESVNIPGRIAKK